MPAATVTGVLVAMVIRGLPGFIVRCKCGAKQVLRDYQRGAAMRVLRREGWVRKKHHTWTCPFCCGAKK